MIEFLMKYYHGKKMAKINKKILKSIVKECLVEILAEGLVPGAEPVQRKKASLNESVMRAAESSHRGQAQTSRSQSTGLQTRGSYLDQVAYNTTQHSAPEPNHRAQNLASKVTADPIMRDILADTANSTLREQAGAESGKHRPSAVTSKPADTAAAIVQQSDPTELFAESAGKWADLAFAPKISR